MFINEFNPYPDDSMPEEDVKRFANWTKEEIIVYKYLEIQGNKTFTAKQLFDNIKGDYPKIPSLDRIGIGLGIIGSVVKGFDFIKFEDLLKYMVIKGKIKSKIAGGSARYFV